MHDEILLGGIIDHAGVLAERVDQSSPPNTLW